MPSTKPEIVVIGVRRSCDTLAIKVFRFSSWVARLVAMLLKARDSSVISSCPSTLTRTVKRPWAYSFAASPICLIGSVIRREIKEITIIAAKKIQIATTIMRLVAAFASSRSNASSPVTTTR